MHNQIKIACLGWGSLIWAPRDLPISSGWFDDGPLLPIEFARESADGRMTLVIANSSRAVRSLWALMSVDSLEKAKAALAAREGIEANNIRYSIGYWDRHLNASHGPQATGIADWTRGLQVDAVVWTNLKVGMRGARDVTPDYEEVLAHLCSLPHERRVIAEEYIRKAPRQIDTDYRRNFERDLGWTPIEA